MTLPRMRMYVTTLRGFLREADSVCLGRGCGARRELLRVLQLK